MPCTPSVTARIANKRTRSENVVTESCTTNSHNPSDNFVTATILVDENANVSIDGPAVGDLNNTTKNNENQSSNSNSSNSNDNVSKKEDTSIQPTTTMKCLSMPLNWGEAFEMKASDNNANADPNSHPNVSFLTDFHNHHNHRNQESEMKNSNLNISMELLNHCVLKATRFTRMSPEQFLSMPTGNSRRECIDDVTIMVVTFQNQDTNSM
jgi:hypothetical protein